MKALSALLLILSTTGNASIIFNEDFDSPWPYPPPGWEIEYTYPNPEIFWSWAYDSSSGYKYSKGQIHLSSGMDNCTAILRTTKFDLEIGDSIDIMFDKHAWDYYYSGTPNSQRVLNLKRGTEIIKTWTIPSSSTSTSWESLEYTWNTVDVTSSDYLLEFSMSAGLVSGMYWLFNFYYIDNLLVSRTSTAIETHSLGRIKSIYR